MSTKIFEDSKAVCPTGPYAGERVFARNGATEKCSWCGCSKEQHHSLEDTRYGRRYRFYEQQIKAWTLI